MDPSGGDLPDVSYIKKTSLKLETYCERNVVTNISSRRSKVPMVRKREMRLEAVIIKQ